MKCEIGIRAHDFPIFDDLDQLATELYNDKLNNIQFSPKFSLKKSTVNGTKMSFGMAYYAQKILSQKEINIAILGCYVNLIHPDEEQRAMAMELFQSYLSYAKAMHCPLVASETGSIDNIFQPHKENWTEEVFELTVEQIKKLTDTAEKLGMLVGIEPGVNHPIYSVATTKRLINEVNSPNLKIIFDPMNLILKETDSEATILRDGIEEFGDKIYAFHIKDYAFNNGQKIVVPFGEGLAPMNEIANIIENYKAKPYVLLEETPKNYFDRSIKRFKRLFY